METIFRIGKMYARADSGFDPLLVVARTPKTVTFRNACDRNGKTWKQRIRTDEDGIEYCYDPYVPAKHRWLTVCRASWEVDE